MTDGLAQWNWQRTRLRWLWPLLRCRSRRFFNNLFVQYSQSDLPPLRPICGEAPGRDLNQGRADLVAGTPTTRPPHLTIYKHTVDHRCNVLWNTQQIYNIHYTRSSEIYEMMFLHFYSVTKLLYVTKLFLKIMSDWNLLALKPYIFHIFGKLYSINLHGIWHFTIFYVMWYLWTFYKVWFNEVLTFMYNVTVFMILV